MTTTRSRPTLSRRAALRLGGLLLAGGPPRSAASKARAASAAGGRPAPAESGQPAASEASGPLLAIGGDRPLAGDATGAGAGPRPLVALDPVSGAERWRFDAGRVVGHAADRVAYAAVMDEEGGGAVNVVALDLATGRERWRAATELTGGVAAAVRAAGGAVYVEAEGALLAFDAADGVERWRVPGGGTGGGWTVVGDAVYLGLADGVVALDAAGGGERWRGGVASGGRAPAVAEGSVYAASEGGVVVALEAATGAERWRAALGAAAEGAPTVAGGLVLVGAGPDPGGILGLGGDEGSVRALDAATGEERWRTGFPDLTGRLVVARERHRHVLAESYGPSAYAPDYTGRLAVFDLGTGQERWGESAVDVSLGWWLGADVVYVAIGGGDVSARDPANGVERWRAVETAGATRATEVGDTVVVEGVWVEGRAEANVFVGCEIATGRERWRVDLAGAAGARIGGASTA